MINNLIKCQINFQKLHNKYSYTNQKDIYYQDIN